MRRPSRKQQAFERELRHRINAGRVAVSNQIPFFSRYFGQVTCDIKEDDTRVTFADFAISEKSFAELRRSFPDDAYCSEESSPGDDAISTAKGFCWVLDPIDGTNNYFLGMPWCAISLALLFNGEPIYGFVYDHAREQLIEGGGGLGLSDGGRRLSPVPAAPLDRHAIVALHFPVSSTECEQLRPILERFRVRSFGSGTLNLTYVALGKIQGALDFKVKVWDVAAACALVRASGAEFHLLNGPVFPMERFHVNMPYIHYLAGTPEFCREALAIVNRGGLPAD